MSFMSVLARYEYIKTNIFTLGSMCETNIDDCASGPCRNGGRCYDQINSYTCDCAQGFYGDYRLA